MERTVPLLVVRTRADQAAEQVKERLIDTRPLNHPPSDPYVYRQRRKIACGDATPAHMMLLQSMADLRDGYPFAVVARPYHEALAHLEAFALEQQRVPAHDQAFLTLSVRETKAQCRTDAEQLRALDNQQCIATMEALERALTEEIASKNDLLTFVRMRRVRLLNSSTPGAA